MPPLPVATSDCLLGAEVRYDGSHRRSSLCHQQLEGLFEFRGLCPEVAIGMGVPRDPIRLVGDAATPRALGVKDRNIDVTDALAAHGRRVAAGLDDVAGYVFMKGSPSCGLFRVKVYPGENKAPFANGRGIYAAEIIEGRPLLPVEENGRLEDDVLRENFVCRVFAYAHWQSLVADGLTAAKLIAFHSRYKYLLMAHSVEHYKMGGRLLSDLSSDLEGRADEYVTCLMAGLTKPATRGRHANVLSHLAGYVSDKLDRDGRAELTETIEGYRRGEIPLLAAVVLLRHHLGRFADTYVLNQVYLDPHPPAAGLRRPL
jgi:uncharacterized protein YbgA (DUF1722 family)/uncharacterized protein YbbK (DUF523 family)